ncbi:MAG: PilZ domain-containing protein [Candidatus Omnitrophica bacterium]|nr:PilZ domain-containing protein [Candidatus Omnitrophota bacterium]MDD5652602.1 PilZ domain-containing protein [Candidatus Omnitrophota bacterium]
MIWRKKQSVFADRRKYIRLDTVFPVQFALVGRDRWDIFLSDWLQGFTRNVSQDGLCLEINNLCAEWVVVLRQQRADLSLKIELPFLDKEIPAVGRIAWMEEPSQGIEKFLVGVHFEEMDEKKNMLFIRYARAKKLFLPVSLGLIAFLASVFVMGTWLNIKLIKGNRALVHQLVGIVQESSIAKQKVKELARQRAQLELEIQNSDSRLQVLLEEEKKYLGVPKTADKKKFEQRKAEIFSLVDKLSADKERLQAELIAVQKKENGVAEELLHLDKKKAQLEKANLEKMYQWLKKRQDGSTGLVISFEGESNIKNWAFIYDQSLALQAYTNFADFERAQMILDFFAQKAKRVNGMFMNAYYAESGSPAELSVQSGSNLWLGIGILQYTKKSQDKTYLGLAEEIARAVIGLQDSDGGIRGGRNIEWFAADHNLDAYAFFNMLYKITGKQEYRTAADSVLKWLLKHVYEQSDAAIKKEKSGAIIATDTYAWSIAAIGPEKLEELGINPERIIELAQEFCSAEVVFCRPEGYSVKLRGFDFAPEQNLARGGVISSEWTAQMVVAYKIMSEYYYKKGLKAKGHLYEMKADDNLATLEKMTISSAHSSGQSCLPFATQSFVDTGHGWMTPKGNSTGCVSGTAYTIFAYYNYNPLEA